MSLDIDLIDNMCSHCGRGECVYEANITHNLGKMAEALDIYSQVWHPEKNGVLYASQLIQPLTDAIYKMKRAPKLYKQYDSPNGWGKYDNFLPWLEGLLAACKEHPNAVVRADR